MVTGDAMVLRLDVVMRRLAVVGFVVVGGGGVAMIAVSLAGLARQTGSQAMYGVLFGLLSLAFAGLVLLGLRRSAASLTVSSTGFAVTARDVAFEVRWAEVTRLRVAREKRRVGRWMHWWFYRLEWTAASGPEFLREGDGYAYALGHLGSATDLYAALERFDRGA
ncbi:hypothetical protein [Amycolatopsis sp. lyj-112]|uniref:hypothetical protein n=1 Tax=Amycolatopsis sp. lyj-112 TaxID=2789288 RepID=UPI00397DAAE4